MNKTIKKITLLWIGLAIIPLGYYFYSMQTAHNRLTSQLAEQSKQFLREAEVNAAQLHAHIQQNFYQLSRSLLLRDYSITKDQKYKEYIKNQWLMSVENNSYFSQLRYIDTQGQEVIRVDNTSKITAPYVVPETLLQNKSQRDYFQYAQQLTAGEQGYFGIDLENEFNQTTLPNKLGFRLIYPITYNHQRLGYFIANLEVINMIESITSNNQTYTTSLVDQNGMYILSNNQQTLSHNIEPSHIASSNIAPSNIAPSLADESPKLWQLLYQFPERAGIYIDNKGLYAFQHFHSTLFGPSGEYLLLSMLPRAYINHAFVPKSEEIKSNALTLLLVLGLFSGMLTLFREANTKRRLEYTFNQELIDNSAAVALTTDQHSILRANVRFCELFGAESSEILGKNILDLQPSRVKYKDILKQLHLVGEWHGELQVDHETRKPRTCKVEIRSLYGTMKKVQYFVYSLTDISEQYETIQELKEKNEQDPTTTLWNKEKFNQTLIHYARLQERYDDQYTSCLAIIDIDNFKQINDKYGHAVGDEVIKWLANQFINILRDTDFIARIGGDEFAVIMQHAGAKTAQQLMQRFCHTIASHDNYSITISVGIAEITEDHQQTFINADKALYRSKSKGKNCVSTHGMKQLSIVNPIKKNKIAALD